VRLLTKVSEVTTELNESQVAVLRRFNRTVTERIGVLRDDYLARNRPIGASRVLWEIGHGVADTRALRTKLGLDSGYLSRLLRALESEGLVELRASALDSRVRVTELTAAGRREVGVLDADSDALAESLLAPLDDQQRRRLIDAASTVERLLVAGLVEIAPEPPTSAAARHCIEQYFRELDDRFDAGFDPELSISAEAHELTEPNGLLLVARLRDQPVGCGALKFHGRAPAEIKRMWIDRSARGLGLGRRMLIALEDQAARRSVSTVRLETNRSLAEAISLYRSAGYREVDAFNDEPFAHHWFEKSLAPSP